MYVSLAATEINSHADWNFYCSRLEHPSLRLHLPTISDKTTLRKEEKKKKQTILQFDTTQHTWRPVWPYMYMLVFIFVKLIRPQISSAILFQNRAILKCREKKELVDWWFHMCWSLANTLLLLVIVPKIGGNKKLPARLLLRFMQVFWEDEHWNITELYFILIK